MVGAGETPWRRNVYVGWCLSAGQFIFGILEIIESVPNFAFLYLKVS